jgi:hypothetical protein
MCETHLLLLAQVAPGPPHTFMPDPLAGQVVLSVQSAVVWQKPPTEFSKHRPPTHLFDRHWLLVEHVVPGHDAMHTCRSVLQLPLSHWLPPVHVPDPPYGILQMPPTQTRPLLHAGVPVPQGVPAGQRVVHGPVPLADAAGASAVCRIGVVHTTAPTTAPRRKRARRVNPCVSDAAARTSGRPVSDEDAAPEPIWR